MSSYTHQKSFGVDRMNLQRVKNWKKKDIALLRRSLSTSVAVWRIKRNAAALLDRSYSCCIAVEQARSSVARLDPISRPIWHPAAARGARLGGKSGPIWQHWQDPRALLNCSKGAWERSSTKQSSFRGFSSYKNFCVFMYRYQIIYFICKALFIK